MACRGRAFPISGALVWGACGRSEFGLFGLPGEHVVVLPRVAGGVVRGSGLGSGRGAVDVDGRVFDAGADIVDGELVGAAAFALVGLPVALGVSDDNRGQLFLALFQGFPFLGNLPITLVFHEAPTGTQE